MRKRLLTSATPFRYCFDHVCLGAAIAYAANRWFLKPVLGPAVPFLHDHLNDVLCIPLFLPPVLYVNYLLGLRPRHRRPTAFEALFHLVVWSVCFEAVAPRLRAGSAFGRPGMGLVAQRETPRLAVYLPARTAMSPRRTGPNPTSKSSASAPGCTAASSSRLTTTGTATGCASPRAVKRTAPWSRRANRLCTWAGSATALELLSSVFQGPGSAILVSIGVAVGRIPSAHPGENTA
jgi:hypothetical protein